MNNLSVNDYLILKSALELKAAKTMVNSPANKDVQRLYCMIDELLHEAYDEAERKRQTWLMYREMEREAQ